MCTNTELAILAFDPVHFINVVPVLVIGLGLAVLWLGYFSDQLYLRGLRSAKPHPLIKLKEEFFTQVCERLNPIIRLA